MNAEQKQPGEVRSSEGLGGSREQRADDGPDDWDNAPERDTTCKHCNGTGGDPWNDGITPCEHCDGEGYEWWQ